MVLYYNDSGAERKEDGLFNNKMQQISSVLKEHVECSEDRNKILNAILANTRMDLELLDDTLKVIDTCCRRGVNLLGRFCPAPQPSTSVDGVSMKCSQPKTCERNR